MMDLPAALSCVLALLLLLTSTGALTTLRDATASWYTGNGFSHMELYTVNGQEYIVVAQKNGLVTLSWDLRQSAETAIGPMNDSQTCMPHQVHRNIPSCEVKPTDNYVRAMYIKGDQLYFCMSYLSGSCVSVRVTPASEPLLVDMSSIAAKLKYSVRGLLCRNPGARIFLTVAERHTDHLGSSVPDGLYLSMPFCVSEKMEPTLSVVDLRTLQPFTVADNSRLSAFLAEVVPPIQKVRSGSLTYHLSFERRSNPGNCSCVYFVLTAADPEPYRRQEDRTRVRIGRLCSADLYLSGYAEIFVDCGGTSGNLVGEAAALAKPGRLLAASLNISALDTDSDVLFLAARFRDERRRGGGVCAFAMRDVDRQLDGVLSDCRQGSPLARYGPSYLRDERPCLAETAAAGGGSSPAVGAPACAQTADWPRINWEGAFSRDGRRVLRAEVLVDSGSGGGENVTAIVTMAMASGETLVYLGTSHGRLLSYRVGTGYSGRLFESSSLRSGGSSAVGRPQPVLALKAGSERMFALTATEVSSQPYASCQQRYSTCSTCLGSANPHCVWSNLAGRSAGGGCRTLRPSASDGLQAAVLREHLLTDTSQCLNVTSLSEAEISVDQPTQSSSAASSVGHWHSVLIGVTNLPESQQVYCLLITGESDQTVATAAAVTGVTDDPVGAVVLNCSLDIRRLRAQLGNLTSKQLVLLLSTSRQPSEPHLASVPVLSFSCERHASCSACAAQKPQCSWCSASGRCAHHPRSRAECGLPEAVVSEGGLCPAVRLSRDGDDAPRDGILLAPSGVAANQRLVYSVTGLQTYMQAFFCSVTCPGSSPATELPADVSSERTTLTCRSSGAPLEYESKQASNVTCDVEFFWSSGDQGSQRRKLDAIDTAGRLVLYKCQAIGTECDACVLRAPAQFGCVWCNGVCRAGGAEACAGSAPVVPRGGLCAHPRLDSVQPAKLAPRPGLLMRVSGANLGNQPDSLSARLVPLRSAGARLDCRLLPEIYDPGRGFQCRVDDAPSEASGGYRLEVTVLGLAAATNQSAPAAASAASRVLAVRTPVATSVTAATVQMRGCAVVRLLGRDLDAGSDLRVAWYRVGLEGNDTDVTTTPASPVVVGSKVLERANGSLTLLLDRFPAIGLYSAELTVQGSKISVKAGSSVTVSVVPDARPIVSDPDRRSGLAPAGGLQFVVSGTGLDAVQRAVMRFRELPADLASTTSNTNATALGLALETPCRLMQSEGLQRMVCLSPAVPETLQSERHRRSATKTARQRLFSATIALDSLEHTYPNNITLYPNPTFERLQTGLSFVAADLGKTGTRQHIRLLGRGLLAAVLPIDIRVRVGSAECSQVSLRAVDRTELVSCSFSLTRDSVNVALPVTASIGKLLFNLGHVTYATEFPWMFVYVGCGVGSVLLFTAALAVCIHVHQKSRRRRDKANGIEVHLNNLEAKVSKTCREAFAELQLNSSPEAGACGREEDPAALAPTPVRSFPQFAAYSCFAERYRDRHRTNDCLFSDVASEDVINGQDSPEVRKCLSQLGNLLQNEDFLMTMIAALEAKTERFSHQERNHFGSLVSAFLFSDPVYFTRVLTGLIRGLIDRKKEAQDNYKVTFRRCDSVAERLLPNWLAFNMYEHLADQVAEPLYRLHREMRMQINRGPVDQVTEDSRYTINEQKLLKKEIPYKPLALIFHDRLRIFRGDEQLQCKVTALDCDTVHQAKDKVLDAVYSRLGVPASQRTHADHYDLVRVAPPLCDRGRPSNEGLLVLPEVDDPDATDAADGLQRLRRLSCLNLPGDVTDGAGPFWVYLRPRKAAGGSIESTRRGLSKGASYADIGSLPSGVSSKSLQDMKHFSNSYSRLPSPRQYHLLQPCNASHTLDRGNKKRRHGKSGGKQQAGGGGSGGGGGGDNQQIVSEVLYPILLSTKKNLVDKITELFKALFPTIPQQPLAVAVDQSPGGHEPQLDQPPNLACLAYLFALIDELARDKGDKSTDVAHMWKSNALMLRFYTHHLLNVEYLLDVDVPGPVRFCLSTVSTLFMDACSVERPRKPDKTSTAQRLLFYTEIADLHARVEAFYASIRAARRQQPGGDAATGDQQLLDASAFAGAPRDCRPFNTGPLLKELFTCFVFKYYDDIVRQLLQHQPCVSDSLIASLQSVMLVLGSESPGQQQQQQLQQHQLQSTLGTRDRKKRSNSRPALDANAYDL